LKIIVAMIVIGVVLLTALVMGINGVLMASGIGLISSLGGFVAGRIVKKPPEKEV